MEDMLDNPESKLLKEKNVKKIKKCKEMKNIQNENRKKTILIIFAFNRKSDTITFHIEYRSYNQEDDDSSFNGNRSFAGCVVVMIDSSGWHGNADVDVNDKATNDHNDDNSDVYCF